MSPHDSACDTVQVTQLLVWLQVTPGWDGDFMGPK